MIRQHEFNEKLKQLIWVNGIRVFIDLNGEPAEKLISVGERGELVAVDNEEENKGFCFHLEDDGDEKIAGVLPSELIRLAEEQDFSDSMRIEEIVLILQAHILSSACQKFLDWIDKGEAWLEYIDFMKTR